MTRARAHYFQMTWWLNAYKSHSTTDIANSFKENLHICRIFVNFLFYSCSLYFFCHPFGIGDISGFVPVTVDVMHLRYVYFTLRLACRIWDACLPAHMFHPENIQSFQLLKPLIFQFMKTITSGMSPNEWLTFQKFRFISW